MEMRSPIGRVLMSAMLVVIAAVTHTARADTTDFVIIAHKSVPVDTLDETEFRNMYLGKIASWEDGSKVVPLTLHGGPVHAAVLHAYVGKTESQFSTYWRKQAFTGNGRPPKELGSDAQMVQAVAATPGAIGYISADVLHEKVKTLTIR